MMRGERYVWNADKPMRDWSFIEVTRVARDGSWADILVCTWAVMWRKRQPLGAIKLLPFEWGDSDLRAQEESHMAWWRGHHEDGPMSPRPVLSEGQPQ